MAKADQRDAQTISKWFYKKDKTEGWEQKEKTNDKIVEDTDKSKDIRV